MKKNELKKKRKKNRALAGIPPQCWLPAFHATDNYILQRKAFAREWKRAEEPVLAVTCDTPGGLGKNSFATGNVPPVLCLGLKKKPGKSYRTSKQ